MDLFNKKRVRELEAENFRLANDTIDLREEICRLQNAIKAAEHDDSKPWVQISGDEYDTVKGVRLSMDWNDAFISYLEDLDFKGPTEQVAVQRWLAMVNLHLIEQLENDAIENDPRGTVKGVVSGY